MKLTEHNLPGTRRLQALVIWLILLLAIAVIVVAVIFKGRYPASPYYILAVVAVNLIPVKHWVYKGLINIGILLITISIMIVYNL